MKTVDNFGLVKERIIRFENKGDFFFVLILKRRKDTKGQMIEGVNEDNLLIKHFFVYSKEYLERKTEAIKTLCEQNDARAYILPQRRNEVTVLCSLLVKVVEIIVERLKNAISGFFKARKENKNLRSELRLAIQNRLSEKEKCEILNRLDRRDLEDKRDEEGDNRCGIHFDHLIRSCVAGCHLSDRKMWVIDLDRDGYSPKFEQFKRDRGENETDDDVFERYVEANVKDIKSLIEKFGKGNFSKDDVFVVPTKNGKHIITPPFASEPKLIRETSIEYDSIKRDGMTVMYSVESKG